MNLDWQRLKAVVLESDDWGLCAWVPDDAAHRALADQPAFRSAPGQRYGRSTLESAGDVLALADTLRAFRGADGMGPAWQANTIVAAPDWDRLAPPWSELPLALPGAPGGRWRRPGLLEAWEAAAADGTWWAELHGLHHLPETAYLEALRRGALDAHAAREQCSFVCEAVEAVGELDAREPREVRARTLREAIARFSALFGRRPASLCPPDYRFDDWIEDESRSLGVTVIQGVPERSRGALAALRRRLLPARFPDGAPGGLRMPRRIAFEPRGNAGGSGPVGVDAAHRAARAAWRAGRPAVLSTHRLNYAHLDPAWAEAGRAALRKLLARLCADGAVFLVDAEVASLAARGWSVRAAGPGAAVLRNLAAPGEPLCFAAPASATGARLSGPAGNGDARVKVADGTAEARAGIGTHRIEWVGA